MICKCCRNCRKSEEQNNKKPIERTVLCKENGSIKHEMDKCENYQFSQEIFDN